MDAAVWTAIGLLAATSLGTLSYLGSRIDALAARMERGSTGSRVGSKTWILASTLRRHAWGLSAPVSTRTSTGTRADVSEPGEAEERRPRC